MDLEEVRKTILDTIFEDDRDQVMEIFSRARQNPIKGAEGEPVSYTHLGAKSHESLWEGSEEF